MISMDSANPLQETDTLGDRLIAASLFIGCAKTSIMKHSGYEKALESGAFTEYMRDLDEVQNRALQMLKQWPAGAVEEVSQNE